ncbi:MAG TPA: hypothetical protein VKY57_16265 [Chitinispirillaceae bacterium]|jgi:hypothetical protein|nr:hypothetical protein [Chitinispirillaceae bacterium]
MMRKYLIICLFLFLGCVNGPEEEKRECTPLSDPDEAVEIMSPKTGDKFTVGDTVRLSFKVNTDLATLGISAQVKFNKNVFLRIDLPDQSLVCVDTVWVIGEEWDDIEYSKSDTVTLIIGKYGEASIWGDSIPGIIIKNPEAN